MKGKLTGRKVKTFDPISEWTWPEHYLEALNLVLDIGYDYDGYNTKSAKEMKKLVDELVKIAKDGITGTPLWVDADTGKAVYSLPKR